MDQFIERYRGIAFGVLLLITITLGVLVIVPFIPAILWATVLSILMYPIYRRLRDRLDKNAFVHRRGMAPTIASLTATVSTLIIICIPFVLIGAALFVQISDLTSKLVGDNPDGKSGITLERVLQQVDGSIGPLASTLGFKDFKLSTYVEEHKEDLGQTLRAPAAKFAREAGFTILTIIIALLTMFFMLRDGERLRDPALRLIPLRQDATARLLSRIAETVHAVFVGTVLVAILQGTVIGVVYAAVGVPNALLLGVFSIILCIIPLLGAPVIYIPMGLYMLSIGNVPAALWIFGVGFGVVSQIDNVLKPFFIGGRANLHPMAIFFSILGGVLLIGPIGVMAGPMLLTLLLALVEVMHERMALQPNAA